MVDVGAKPVTRRAARAGARVWMAVDTLRLLQEQALPKGDVLAVARVAGIMAAKRTSELVPLCHPLSLTHVDVTFTVVPDESRLEVECTAQTEDRTGVEMEALTGAVMAAITIYDMCKAVDQGMVIGDIRLLEKTGGKRDYLRPGEPTADSTQSGAPASARGQWAMTAVVAASAAAGPMEDLPEASGTVVAVSMSTAKGDRKTPVPEAVLRVDHGIEGDVHAGHRHRQVSLLAQESIDKMTAAGLDVGPGDFAENITTRGLQVASLPLRTTLDVGEALVEVTQIGKVCHSRCAIYERAGDCVMPREGIFVRVLKGGRVAPGDPVQVRAWGAGGAARTVTEEGDPPYSDAGEVGG